MRKAEDTESDPAAEEAAGAEALEEPVEEAEVVEEASDALLKEKEDENRKLYNELLKLRAEFENYRKRVDREKPELIRHGKRELLERLLPLYDVLLAAHQQVTRHAEQGETAGAAKELVRGLEMIFEQFTKMFDAEGVERIECVGKPYDFDKHEVLGQEETSEHPDGTVVAELQPGYLLEGRVLRPAKVRIARSVKK